MQECYKVPAAAWQLLATARWEQLRKADFTWRLGGRHLKRGGSFLEEASALSEGKASFCQRPACCDRSPAKFIDRGASMMNPRAARAPPGCSRPWRAAGSCRTRQCASSILLAALALLRERRPCRGERS